MDLQNALELFRKWRFASTPIEVDWFACQPGEMATARVSLDGLVTQAEASGLVTVSGEGREIELDLRECSFRRPKNGAGLGAAQPNGSESMLEIDFPAGEVCLVLPNRRVATPHPVGGQILRGLQWSKTDFSLFLNKPEEPAAPAAAEEAPKKKEEEKRKVPPPKIVKVRPPLMPVIAVMLTTALILLIVVPLQIPEKLLGYNFSRPSVNDPSAMVWVIPSEGAYYCAGSVMHGRQPGRLMPQGQALTLGYQPALGLYCSNTGESGRLPGPIARTLAGAQKSARKFLSRVAGLPSALWSELRPEITDN